MIEDELRQAFLNAEDLVSDASQLLPGIEAKARRRRARQRVVRTTAAALAVLVVIAVPTWFHQLLEIRQALMPAAPASQAAPSEAVGPMNFIIAGLDGRVASPAPQRSDALIIAHVPADHSAVYLVSIPRDLEVDIPGHGPDKVNEAYALGQGPLLARTVAELTGLKFDGAVVVDFDGLTAMVDKLGGLRMCVDVTTKSWHTGDVFAVGCRTFRGAEVKDYLRQRLGLPNGAFDRDRHVAQFLAALARQVTDAGTFTDLGKLRAIAGAMGTSVTVDVGNHNVVNLAWDLRTSLRQVISVELPTTPPYPASMEKTKATTLKRNLAQAPEAAGLFDALRSDTMATWVAANPKAVQPLG